MAPKKARSNKKNKSTNVQRGKPAPEAPESSDLGVIDAALLRTLPLPPTDGQVLVVGGSTEMPGALLLAGIAALRAGASKLQLATVRPTAHVVALHVPEARVYALDATRNGAIDSQGARDLTDRLKNVGALLLGPGMIDSREAERFVGRIVSRLDPKRGPMLVLDAEATLVLQKFPDLLRRVGGRAIVALHVRQLGALLGMSREEAKAGDPLALARQAAKEWRAVVIVKGAETIVASSDGRAARSVSTVRHAAHTLAGIVAGIAARGGNAFEAAIWAVHLHARAGEAVAKKIGPTGFLARELLDEVPGELAALDKATKSAASRTTINVGVAKSGNLPS